MKYGILGILWAFCLLSCQEKLTQQNKEKKLAQSQEHVKKIDSVYLFTSFREPADKGLFLAYSEDGYRWKDLGGPYLKPEVGTSKIMRDPSIARGNDNVYHMVWTTDWRGGKGFGYASTTDFIHWTKQRFIPVMAHEPEVVNVWAPEIFFDKSKERFIVLWASTIPYRFEKGEEEENNNHRMYYTTTKDFEKFEDTRLLWDAGFSMIDCVIIERGENDYVLVLKDNTRPNRNLKVAFSSSPLGPYHNISESFSGFLTEGPTVIEQDGKYIIYFDNYGEKNFGAVETSNFEKFTDISDSLEFPEGHKHGTIVRVPREAVDKLLLKNQAGHP